MPGARVVAFGHIGDGNIHFNVSQPVGADKAAFLARWEAMNEVVHAIVARLGGSFSAEHGIGRLKRELLARDEGPRRARRHARDQGGARPERDDESGQGALTEPASKRSFDSQRPPFAAKAWTRGLQLCEGLFFGESKFAAEAWGACKQIAAILVE